MLTQVDVGGVAGINGVPWDAVELQVSFRKLVLAAKLYVSYRVTMKRVSLCRCLIG